MLTMLQSAPVTALRAWSGILLLVVTLVPVLTAEYEYWAMVVAGMAQPEHSNISNRVRTT